MISVSGNAISNASDASEKLTLIFHYRPAVISSGKLPCSVCLQVSFEKAGREMNIIINSQSNEECKTRDS